MPEQSSAAAAIKPTLHVFVETLLDWPFLLFILLAVILYVSRDQIAEILRTRQIEVSLGGNKISIGDAVQELDMERKQAIEDFRKHEEDIEALQIAIDMLRNGVDATAGAGPPGGEPESSRDAERATAAGRNRRPGSFDRMLHSISESKYRWRSLERLAIEARVSESDALAILQQHADQIVIGKSKAGKILARLKETDAG